ncbi:hypothetical protein H1R20_g11054, partial [Candolleomyces eurysporus]
MVENPGILQSYLRDETLHDEVDLDKLAAEAEGFSGSDLKNLCVAAAVASVKETIGSGWRNTEKPSNSQGSSKDSEDGSGSIEAAEELPTRMITPSNITQAQNEITRSHSYVAAGPGGKNSSYVIDTQNFRSITYDPTSQTAIIGVGAGLGDIIKALRTVEWCDHHIQESENEWSEGRERRSVVSSWAMTSDA